MSIDEVVPETTSLEASLSKLNAKLSIAYDLSQQTAQINNRLSSLVATVQQEIEELYISLEENEKMSPHGEDSETIGRFNK